MSSLGAAADARTPAIDALIELSRNMTGKDFSGEARTLDRLSLSGIDVLQSSVPSRRDPVAEHALSRADRAPSYG